MKKGDRVITPTGEVGEVWTTFFKHRRELCVVAASSVEVFYSAHLALAGQKPVVIDIPQAVLVDQERTSDGEEKRATFAYQVTCGTYGLRTFRVEVPETFEFIDSHSIKIEITPNE